MGDGASELCVHVRSRRSGWMCTRPSLSHTHLDVMRYTALSIVWHWMYVRYVRDVTNACGGMPRTERRDWGRGSGGGRRSRCCFLTGCRRRAPARRRLPIPRARRAPTCCHRRRQSPPERPPLPSATSSLSASPESRPCAAREPAHVSPAALPEPCSQPSTGHRIPHTHPPSQPYKHPRQLCNTRSRV